LVLVGLCTVLFGLAAPAMATPLRPAATALSAAASASRSAIPSPYAPHSGKAVPGITGAAAGKADPPVSAAKRFAQLNAASHRAASHSAARHRAARHRAASQAAPAGPSAMATPGLSSWSGAFHGYWGTFPSQTLHGAQATQSLNPSITLGSSSPDIIYSPTLDPSGITCIEMSTIYFSDGDQVGAWDWCASSPGFKKVADVTSSFLGTYSTTISGHAFYSVQNVQTNPTTNSWTAYLYNYTTKAWDTFYTSANTSKLSNSGGGWDMNEAYTNYNASTGEGDYCTPTRGAFWETTGLQYQLSSGGAWTPPTPANSSTNLAYPRGSDMGCDGSGYALPTENSNWYVTNAGHAAAELIGAGSGKCIDTNGPVFANGTKEQIYTCHNGPGQTWTYNASGELTVDGGKYCLDATNYGTTNGTKLQLYSCRGTTNQEWTFSVKHALVGVGSGLCVDVTKYGTANGTQLQLWQCSDTSNQQWSWS
jgi:hypothetical protein